MVTHKTSNTGDIWLELCFCSDHFFFWTILAACWPRHESRHREGVVFLHGIVVAPKVLAVRYESVQRLCIYSDIVSLSSRILHCFGSGCSGINVQPSVQGWGHRMVYDANVEEGANRRDELENGGLALAICGCFKVPEFHLWSSLAAASLIVYKHLQTKTVTIGNYSWKQTSTKIYKHLLWLSTILKIY